MSIKPTRYATIKLQTSAISVCATKTNCIKYHTNESQPCDPTDTNICNRKICKAGKCLAGAHFWDNTTCAQSAICSVYKCYGGNCDYTQFWNSPQGTICGGGGNPCKQYECDANGNCLSVIPDGTPCYTVSVTYKRAAAPPSTPTQCQAYTCVAGACTSHVQNIDNIHCVGNFTNGCLAGVCLSGLCSPKPVNGCNPCEQFKTCSTCAGGSFSSIGSRRDVEVGAAATAGSLDPYSSIVQACRKNPNLPQCKLNCSWCNGQCLGTDEVTEMNTYYPPGSANRLTCTGSCPVVEVASGGNDNALPIGLGVGLGGGALLAAAVVAGAVIAVVIAKKRMAAPDSSLAEVSFVDNVATQEGAVYVKPNEVQRNALYQDTAEAQ